MTLSHTHTLTVTGRLEGLYSCNVSNGKPSNDSAQLRVKGALTVNCFLYETILNSTIIIYGKIMMLLAMPLVWTAAIYRLTAGIFRVNFCECVEYTECGHDWRQ